MAQLRKLECSSEEAVRWTVEALARSDLQVATSFDLRKARAAHVDSTCPHHRPRACDCQMVVLLVYDKDELPATLLIHSSNGHSWLSLTDFPGQRPTPSLRVAISNAIIPESAPISSRD